MKSHSGEQVNSLGSCFPVKGMSYERNVICSAVFEINEDMILALAGQFKQVHVITFLPRGSVLIYLWLWKDQEI